MLIFQLQVKEKQRFETGDISAATLSAGTLVAVLPDVDHCISTSADPVQQPWIAKVTGEASTSEDKIRVVWLEGNLKGKFRERMLKKDKTTPDIDDIHTASIFLSGFRLLNSGSLPAWVINTIRQDLADQQRTFVLRSEESRNDDGDGSDDEFLAELQPLTSHRI